MGVDVTGSVEIALGHVGMEKVLRGFVAIRVHTSNTLLSDGARDVDLERIVLVQDGGSLGIGLFTGYQDLRVDGDMLLQAMAIMPKYTWLHHRASRWDRWNEQFGVDVTSKLQR